MVDIIDGALFQRMVIHASASINAQKQAINELNVFPVPDGDTGTNMSLTIGTAAAEAKKKPAQAVGQATTTAVVHSIVGIIVATAVITVICNVLGV